jgi:hypothetical protein
MTLNMKQTGALLLSASALLFPVPPLEAGTESDLSTSLANASYQGIEDSPVQLENGRWEGKPYVEGGASRPSVGLVEDFSLQGDLDGDGNPETVRSDSYRPVHGYAHIDRFERQLRFQTEI